MFSLPLSALVTGPTCTFARSLRFRSYQSAVYWGVPAKDRKNALTYYTALREDGKTHAQAVRVIRAAIVGGKDCPAF